MFYHHPINLSRPTGHQHTDKEDLPCHNDQFGHRGESVETSIGNANHSFLVHAKNKKTHQKVVTDPSRTTANHEKYQKREVKR